MAVTTIVLALAILCVQVAKVEILNGCDNPHEFTQKWRKEGRNIQGGGDKSESGWACDIRRDLGWFRFTGDAGKDIQ